MKNKISYFGTRTVFSGIGISYLFKSCGTSFFIAIILGIIFGSALIILLSNLKSCKITKKIGNGLYLLICLIILINLCHSLYLPNTPIEFLAIFSLFIIYVLSTIKYKSFERLSKVLFLISIFLFLNKTGILYFYITPENFLPLKLNIVYIIKNAFIYAIISVTPILIIDGEDEKDVHIINYLISSITILIISMLVTGVLGINEAKLYRYPEYIVLKRIKLLDFISNVENVFGFAILTDIVFSASISLKNTLVKSKLVNIVILIVSFFLTVYACKQNWTILMLYKYFPYIMIFLLLLQIIPSKKHIKNKV